METLYIAGSLAFLAAVTGLALVVESGRRNRRATRKAEERRRRQQREAKLREIGGEPDRPDGADPGDGAGD